MSCFSRKAFIPNDVYHEVLEQVRAIPIEDVFRSRGIHVPADYKPICPFHPDRKPGSFIINPNGNFWYCHTCGFGGDGIKFISMYDGIEPIEAIVTLSREFRIFECEDYGNIKPVNKIRTIEKKVPIETEEFGSPEELDSVFSILISHSHISEEHRRVLLEERNLPISCLDRKDFFTFPRLEVSQSIFKEVEAKHGGLDILKKIPGFYLNKNTNSWEFIPQKGIGIAIRNAEGLIVGIQIRKDVVKEGQSRYVWFSSSFTKNNDELDFGTSSKAPLDVVYPERVKNRCVVITEGRFKAQKIADKMGLIAISVQGVANWKGIDRELSIVNEKLEENSNLNGGIAHILTAFDADTKCNINVYKHLAEMTNSIIDKYNVVYLSWEEKYGKGIDDVFNSGHPDKIKKYDKSTWDKSFEKMIEYAIISNNLKTERELSKEILRELSKLYLDKITPMS